MNWLFVITGFEIRTPYLKDHAHSNLAFNLGATIYYKGSLR
jgi:hypothetical protein